MASEVKNVKILTKGEQKQSIRGFKKPKKNITKNYLESPFALEWPKITSENEEEISALLRKSCQGLKKVECKRPWKRGARYKGPDRKEYLREYYRKFEESLDADSIKKNKEIDEALSHLLFGYNKVMRALEQDDLAGILLNINVQPSFIAKAFLPGCAKKCIPLVPVNDLEQLLKDKETLGLPHRCLVLGLKPSVKDEANLFHALFTKMCEALGIEESPEDSRKDEEESVNDPAPIKEEKENPTPSTHRSEVDISVYHLKRSDKKGRRAFNPGVQEHQVTEANSSDDFLSCGSMQNQQEGLELHASSTKPKETSENNKPEDLKTSQAVSENVDFSSMILIDPSGDESALEESSTGKHETCSNVEKPADDDGEDSQKRKNIDFYVPAKTKQVRGNPDRKGNVM